MNTDNNIIHSDLKKTLELMHNAQGYPMIEVRGLAEAVHNQWLSIDYLFVRLGDNKMLRYAFLRHYPDGSDSLYGVNIVDSSFNDILIEYSRRVIGDGQAILIVHPW
jgi:hypothetical protein